MPSSNGDNLFIDGDDFVYVDFDDSFLVRRSSSTRLYIDSDEIYFFKNYFFYLKRFLFICQPLIVSLCDVAIDQAC